MKLDEVARIYDSVENDKIATWLNGNVPGGSYTVQRLLPEEGRDCQYRVKDTRDGHERVVRESQLATQRPLGH